MRHPATKPFVPPEALAAATTNATLEAVRKAAADSQKEAASASLVDALLKAHAGDNSQLLAQLENVQGGAVGSSQVSSCMRLSRCTSVSKLLPSLVRSGMRILSRALRPASAYKYAYRMLAAWDEGLKRYVGLCATANMLNGPGLMCRTLPISWTP